jgi:hypothetical protein
MDRAWREWKYLPNVEAVVLAPYEEKTIQEVDGLLPPDQRDSYS